MRLPEVQVATAKLLSAAAGPAVVDAPAGVGLVGARLMLREIDGVRCLEVRVLKVRLHTGAVDRLTVRAALPRQLHKRGNHEP